MNPLKTTTKSGIHLGKRDESFKRLITNVLEKGQVPQKYIDILTNEENLKTYADAFTSKYVDYYNNYEVYEQLGDATASKFLVSYFYTRFPQLVCDAGVKIVARLKINYGSKKTFSNIARELGFWDFISETNQRRFDDENSLLEDVFEAFIGTTENLMDAIKFGLGYVCVYNILKVIFDGIEISLDYEDLYDAKTILKETFDLRLDREPYGKLEWENIPTEKWVAQDDEQLVFGDTEREVLSHFKKKPTRLEKRTISLSILKNVLPNTRVPFGVLAQEYGLTSKEAEQEVSKKVLSMLLKYNILPKYPKEYTEFKNNTRDEKIDIKRFDISNIDNQLHVKGQSKFYKEYTSTLLGFACQKRDVEVIKLCLEKKANVNAVDINGLYVMDLLFVGSILPKKMKKICELFKNKGIFIHSNVYENYYKQYMKLDVFFKEFEKNLIIKQSY